jgi:GTP cyclohydrolase II
VDGGVLVRAGQTEAAVDLARLAGLHPAGRDLRSEDEDGTMARGPRLEAFCREHALKLVTIKDLIQHRMRNERLVRKIVEADLPTGYGPFRIHAFESGIDRQHHIALVLGDLSAGDEPALVRVHSQCLTGDIFASLALRLRRPAAQGAGDDQPGRPRRPALPAPGGPGHRPRAQAHGLPAPGPGQGHRGGERGLGFKADQRDYGIGAQILVELGVKKIRLLTNNPRKFVGLEGYGLEIVGACPSRSRHDANRRYLKTKKEKLGHILRSVLRCDPAVLRSSPSSASSTTRSSPRSSWSGMQKRYPQETVILTEGAPGGQLHVINQGRVRISKVVPGVGEEALTILGPASSSARSSSSTAPRLRPRHRPLGLRGLHDPARRGPGHDGEPPDPVRQVPLGLQPDPGQPPAGVEPEDLEPVRDRPRDSRSAKRQSERPGFNSSRPFAHVSF